MLINRGLNHRLTQAGDTIVEVLISVAIVSLVLVTAYASTRHSTSVTQDTQEHSQALQLIQAQIELLRAKGNPALVAVTDTCYDNTSGAASASCTFQSDGTVAPAGVNPAFQLAISAPDANGVYTISAKWVSLLNDGTDTAQLYYGPPGG